MTLQKRRNTLAILLLAVSLLAIAPTLTRADQQKQNGTITISANGQATPIDKKATGGPTTLTLTGNVHAEGNDPLKINGLTGNLQVGGTTYPISDGHGEANKKGAIQINAKSNGKGNGNHNYELILHGSMQGSSLTFDSHESKLSSMFFLSLSGQASLSINQNSSSSTSESESETENESHHGSTVTQTVTVTQNNNATTSVFSNQTVTQTITQPQNVTIATTQFNNQTITVTVTNTIANSTITQTATTTVANTTLTQTTTTTVANTTITVTTNSTTLPP